jgi:hypothetical protein
VHDVLVAARAEFLPLHPLRMRALVLGGEVVPVLTVATRENDLVAGHGTEKTKKTAKTAKTTKTTKTTKTES